MDEGTDRMAALLDACQAVIEAHYIPTIIRRKQEGHKTLPVNVLDIKDLDVRDEVLEHPRDAALLFEAALARIDLDLPPRFSVRFINAPASATVRLGFLRAEHVSHLIEVEGIVRSQSEVIGEIISATFACPFCEKPTTIIQDDIRTFKTPSACSGCARRGRFREVTRQDTDRYTITLEEPTDHIDAQHQPNRLSVVCRGELASPSAYRGLYNQRVRVTGILRELREMGRKGPTGKFLWYVEATAIVHVGEAFAEVVWTDADVETFQAFAAQPDWLDRLRHGIFHDVHGHDTECKAVVLQLFGGVRRARPTKNVRGNVHVLLVGDPGTAKSTILEITKNFSPKGMYVSATGISAAGIEGGVVKEELTGRYVLESGVLSLCNGGLLMLDELDKTSDEARAHLHTAMEQEQVIISKIVKGTFITQTAILAAANPRHGQFSPYDVQGLFGQINLLPSLINRFDLVFPMLRSDVDADGHKAIARKMMAQRRAGADALPPLDPLWCRKYIAYARTLEPHFPEEHVEAFAQMYAELCETQVLEKGRSAVPISPRNGEAVLRLSEAVARSHLHREITKEDIAIATETVLASLRRLGADPTSGSVVEQVVADSGTGPKVWLRADVSARVSSLIRSRGQEGIAFSVLRETLAAEGLTDREVVERHLAKLKAHGDVFENPYDHYRWIE